MAFASEDRHHTGLSQGVPLYSIDPAKTSNSVHISNSEIV